MELTGQRKEAYELVCELNETMLEQYGEQGVEEDLPGFSVNLDEYTVAILWGKMCVWCSEHDYFDENGVPEYNIRSIVKREIETLTNVGYTVVNCHAYLRKRR